MQVSSRLEKLRTLLLKAGSRINPRDVVYLGSVSWLLSSSAQNIIDCYKYGLTQQLYPAHLSCFCLLSMLACSRTVLLIRCRQPQRHRGTLHEQQVHQEVTLTAERTCPDSLDLSVTINQQHAVVVMLYRSASFCN